MLEKKSLFRARTKGSHEPISFEPKPSGASIAYPVIFFLVFFSYKNHI